MNIILHTKTSMYYFRYKPVSDFEAVSFFKRSPLKILKVPVGARKIALEFEIGRKSWYFEPLTGIKTLWKTALAGFLLGGTIMLIWSVRAANKKIIALSEENHELRKDLDIVIKKWELYDSMTEKIIVGK